MIRVFIDTNVLCYTHDDKRPLKRARAEEILSNLQSPDFVVILSTQVLQEFYNTLTRKFDFSAHEAKAELVLLQRVQTVLVNPTIIYAAADLHASASISFWDALIVSAAQSVNCDEIWTEDMEEGRRFGRLNIVNPFKGIAEQ